MQSICVTCPCCGRSFVFTITDNGTAVKADEIDMIQMASDLGVELGVAKGGEKVGE